MAEYVHTRADEQEVVKSAVGDVDEIISTQRQIALGFQQALVSNAWLDPIFIASVAGFSAAGATEKELNGHGKSSRLSLPRRASLIQRAPVVVVGAGAGLLPL